MKTASVGLLRVEAPERREPAAALEPHEQEHASASAAAPKMSQRGQRRRRTPVS